MNGVELGEKEHGARGVIRSDGEDDRGGIDVGRFDGDRDVGEMRHAVKF